MAGVGHSEHMHVLGVGRRLEEILAGSLSRPWSLHISVAHGGGNWYLRGGGGGALYLGPQQSRPRQRRRPCVPTVFSDMKAIKGQQGLFPLRRMDGKGEGFPWG